MQFLKITDVDAPAVVPVGAQGARYPLKVHVSNIRKTLIPGMGFPLKCVVTVDSVHPGGVKEHVESAVTTINSGEEKEFFMDITQVPPLMGLQPPYVDNHIVRVHWVIFMPTFRRVQDSWQLQVEKITAH